MITYYARMLLKLYTEMHKGQLEDKGQVSRARVKVARISDATRSQFHFFPKNARAAVSPFLFLILEEGDGARRGVD